MLSRLFFFLATFLVATTTARSSVPHRIPRRFSPGNRHQLLCQNWRISVETNNAVAWKTVPRECENYVASYMSGNEYKNDFEYVINEAIIYATSFDNLPIDPKNVWIFDVDETTLSNLPYFARHRFGTEPFNSTAFDAWVLEGKASVFTEALKLYKVLLSLKIKVIFLTARTQDKRIISATNLKRVGFHTWEKFILRGSEYEGKSVSEYKSSERKKLESDGYRIVGNIGDQWSDVLGTNTGYRNFKLPNPMYYIS